MKKILLLSAVSLLFFSSCSMLESKEKSMNKEEDWKAISLEIKELIKDKKDLYMISFDAKDKMKSTLENVSIHYKKDEANWEFQKYKFEPKTWSDPESTKKPTMVTYFSVDKVDLEIIPTAYKNACEKIIEGEKYSKDKVFALNRISFMGNGTSLTLQTGAGKNEYLEFYVTVNKDGSVSYQAQ
jgi:hypothetical protein